MGEASDGIIRPVHLINADLHSHSTVSDGTLAPEAVAERAAQGGVRLWALTDHDEVGGLERADFVFKEWLGLLAYRLTGRTDALFPGPVTPTR